jgi:RNA recognition motif-containing protein
MSLLFSNVAFDCTDEDLRRWIEERRFSVVSINLIRDVISGTSPSFAYVELASSHDEAERALNGGVLKGRTLKVRRVVPLQTAAARERAAGTGH